MNKPAFISILIAILIGNNYLAGHFAPSRQINLLLGQSLVAVADVFLPPADAAQEWTCSMHPQIRRNAPGKCPICFMDLIPIAAGKTDGGHDSDLPDRIRLSPEEEKLAGVQVVPVIRRFADVTIELPGKVGFDETSMAYITARVPGRIDRLFVNYTGIPVRRGDHMADYYSPDLLVAQHELLLAYRSGPDRVTSDSMLASVKKKLELWGMTPKNIEDVLKNGRASDNMTLYAPISGIVVEKNAVEGKYFQTGDRLFTLADLNTVWIMLDAFEHDLSRLRYGQNVTFVTEAWPGETFTGRIAFISPVLDSMTRTAAVRINAANPKGLLKPGMIVTARVKARINAAGQVIDENLRGKWICPMHPEVLKEKPGRCPICGMALLRTEAMGYAGAVAEKQDAPLLIPASAPLITGKRAIVYVSTAPGIYQGREITLGPRASDYYIVKNGLREDELVVVNGAFRIDSEMQLRAKHSMMSPETATPPPPPAKSMSHHAENKPSPNTALLPLYRQYFAIRQALSKDDLPTATAAAGKAATMLPELKIGNSSDLQTILKQLSNAPTAVTAREQFANLTAVIADLFARSGTGGLKVYRFQCPMAFDNKGAEWFQESDDLGNPYFGQAMLRCGSKTGELTP